MTTEYRFVTAFNDAFSRPDAFDLAGWQSSNLDKYFEEFGKLAKKVQEGKLMPSDAEAVRRELQIFTDGINRANAWIAQRGIGTSNAQDAKFAQAFKGLVSRVNLAMQQYSYAADEVLAGNPSSFKRLTGAASNFFRNAGGLFGLWQIGDQFWSEGFTPRGVDGAGQKALGVITGLAGAELASILAGGALAAFGAPALVTAGAALGAAVFVGYAGGKVGEALWEPSRWWFENEFLPSVFQAGTEAYDTVAVGLADRSIALGKFDGTWLEGLEVPNQQKAALTTLLAGVSGLPSSASLQADIEKLFQAPFEAETLVARDALLQAVMIIAKEQSAYVSERVVVNGSEVALTLLPSAHPNAAVSLRAMVESMLDAGDRAGFAITGPERVVVSASAGTVSGNSARDLLIGTAGVDGLIGADGDDELVAAGGADTLLGQGGLDVLFGGAGDDLLDGGAGGDYLFGGSEFDTYQLATGELADTIRDSDGQGRITVDGQLLQGGKKAADGYWISDDLQWGYSLSGSGDLVISKGTSLDTIKVQGWQAGQLGITLDNSPAATTPGTLYIGDQRAPLNGAGNYNWGATSWQADGTLSGGVVEAGFYDVIYGTGSNDRISGRRGNDVLDGRDGNDFIEGNEDNDMIAGGAGSDTIFGGAGNDIIYSAGSFDAPQRVGPNDNWNPTSQTVGGPAGTDTAPDVIDAGDGSDFVRASYGHDYVSGGAGADELWGMAGRDIINGGADADQIMGDAPEAVLAAQLHGNDTLDGGAGADLVIGYGGNDDLYGGSDNDELQGDAHSAHLAGQHHGNDYLAGEGGADMLIGGGGDDDLLGGTENDILAGDANVTELSGQYHGQDFLDGGDGADMLYGDGQDDELFGGEGDDHLWGDNSVDIGSSGYVPVQYHGDDYLDGESGHDYLEGGGGADQLFGGDGNDTLWGDGDALRLAGTSHGADYIDGGDNDDALLGGGAGDTLLGGSGNDLIRGDGSGHLPGESRHLAGQYHGNDFLDGGDGNDTLYGDGGNDTLLGGANDDILHGDAPTEQLAATYHGDDYIDGGDGNDQLYGWGGADTLIGGSGNDFLRGFDGGGELVGGDGNDILYGGGGDDILRGGEGNDWLYTDDTVTAGGHDVVDAGAGDDTIWLLGSSTVTVDAGAGRDTIYSDIAGNVTVYFGRGDGQDLLEWDRGGSAGTATTIQLKDGVAVSDLDVYRRNYTTGISSLVIGIRGTADCIEIYNYPFPGTTYGGSDVLPQFRLANGAVWAPALTDLGVFQYGPATFQATQIDGGASSDLLFTGSTDYQSVFAGAGDDRIYGLGGLNKLLYGGDGNDIFGGGTSDEFIYGETGNDLLDGGGGTDWLSGGEGENTFVFGRGAGHDTITAKRQTSEQGLQTIVLADLLPGDVELRRVFGEYNNVGDDLEIRVIGSTDILTVSAFFWPQELGGLAFDVDRIRFSDGTEWKYPEILANLTVENLFLTGSYQLWGGAGDDVLEGSSEWNSMRAGAGTDIMRGHGGDDTYWVGDAGDQTIEAAGEGNDWVFAPVSWTLAENIERLTLLDAQFTSIDPFMVALNINGTGNALNNIIEGTIGDNVLDGAAGTDTLRGGLGNDTYLVDVLADVIEEFADGGTDTVISTHTRTLGAHPHLENLTLSSSAAINGTGNALNNVLTGGVGANTLTGQAGDDTLDGGAGTDSLVGGTGNDTYRFGTGYGADTISENDSTTGNLDVLMLKADVTLQNVRLQRASGSNNLVVKINGTSDQVTVTNYFLNAANRVEEIRFASSPGTVLLFADVNALATTTGGSLPAGVTLAGAGPVNGTQYADTLEGTAYQSVVNGAAGNDSLSASNSPSVFDVRFNGGIGNDTITGSYGGDAYIFNLGDGQDVIRDDVARNGQGPADYFAANPTASSYQDRIEFGAAITPDMVTRKRVGSNFEFSLDGGDKITVEGWFDGTPNWKIERVEFAAVPGFAWSLADLEHDLPGISQAGGGSLAGTAWADTLDATAQGTILNGGAGDDRLAAVVGTAIYDITFRGGTGADTMIGSYAKDLYEFNLGDGHDTIHDNVRADPDQAIADAFMADPAAAFYQDRIQFGAGITADMVSRSRSTIGDLVLSLASGTDSLTIRDWFDGTLFSKIEQASFADGTVWSADDMEFGQVVAGGGNVLGSDFADTLRATAYGATLNGGWGDDQLLSVNDGAVFAVNFDGGFGNDILTGSYGGDIYHFRLGDGRDTITDDVRRLNQGAADYFAANPTDPGYQDRIQFAAGITADTVTHARQGNDMVLTLNAGGDSITVKNWFDGTIFNKIERAAFADGTLWTASDMENGLDASGGGTLAGSVYADTLRATAYGTQLEGGSGDDQLLANNDGGIFAVTFKGGAGNDVSIGSYGGDRYIFNIGDGHDTITDDTRRAGQGPADYFTANPEAASYQDILQFGAGIKSQNVTRSRVGNDLLFTLSGGNDSIKVKNWYDGTILNRIEKVEFTDTGSDMAYWTAAVIEGGLAASGTADSETLYGSAGADSMFGYAGHDRLIGGKGNDTLQGGTGNDTYELARGDGHDTVTDDDTVGTDVASFGTSIAAAQLWFQQQGNDLRVGVIGTADGITVSNWYQGSANRLEFFRSGDGKYLEEAAVQNLVQAMASFAPPAAGQTTLPQNYQDALGGVIAANWS